MRTLKTSLAVAFTMAITLCSNAGAQEQPFYRGGLDDQKGTAPNGAIVNEGYRDFLLEGPFAQTQMIEVQ